MLAKNIQKARRNKGLTQKQISELIGVKAGTYSGYETGNSEPPVDIICKIAEVTQTSVEQLVGNAVLDQPQRAINNTIGENIRKARVTRRMTQTELGNKIGVKHSTIAGYEQGTSRPSSAIIGKLASVFGVEPEHLYEIEPPEPKQEIQPEQDTEVSLILAQTNQALVQHLIELGRALVKKI